MARNKVTVKGVGQRFRKNETAMPDGCMAKGTVQKLHHIGVQLRSAARCLQLAYTDANGKKPCLAPALWHYP